MTLPGTVFSDLRYAARMLRRNAGFTAVAIMALALGIGVNTAVLTAYKTMVARPLQARNPGEMVNLTLLRGSGAANYTFSYPDYAAYRDSVHSFSGLIATNHEQMRVSTGDGIVSQRTSMAGSGLGRLGLLSSGASNAEFASVLVVSENYFQVLGVAALRGRTFDAIGVPELVGLALGSDQRKLLAEALCEGSGSAGENYSAQWRCSESGRNHAARLCGDLCRRA